MAALVSDEALNIERQFDETNLAEFWVWLADEGYGQSLKVQENQRSILAGLITGSEIALLVINWWYITIGPYLFHFNLNAEMLCWLILFPFLLLAFSWYSDRFYTRYWSRKAWLDTKRSFLRHLKEEEKKEGKQTAEEVVDAGSGEKL